MHGVGSEEKHFMSAHYKIVLEGLSVMTALIAHGTWGAQHPAAPLCPQQGRGLGDYTAVSGCVRALRCVIPGWWMLWQSVAALGWHGWGRANSSPEHCSRAQVGFSPPYHNLRCALLWTWVNPCALGQHRAMVLVAHGTLCSCTALCWQGGLLPPRQAVSPRRKHIPVHSTQSRQSMCSQTPDVEMEHLLCFSSQLLKPIMLSLLKLTTLWIIQKEMIRVDSWFF